MIIALDCDNVVLDFLGKWEQMLRTFIDRPITANKRHYELTRRYALSRYEYEKCWNYFEQGEMWESLNLLAGADLATQELQKLGHEVHIVTSIKPEFRKNRIVNLDKHSVVYDDIHCVGQMQSKTELYKRIGADVVIDDYSEHIKEAHTLGIPNRILIKSGLITSDESAFSTRIYESLISATNSNLGLSVANKKRMGSI